MSYKKIIGGATMEELQHALEFIKENKVYGVDVNLHLHFDRDEEFDYTGNHSVMISASTMRYDEFIKKDRSTIFTFDIDLEGLSVDDCRKKTCRNI